MSYQKRVESILMLLTSSSGLNCYIPSRRIVIVVIKTDACHLVCSIVWKISIVNSDQKGDDFNNNILGVFQISFNRISKYFLVHGRSKIGVLFASLFIGFNIQIGNVHQVKIHWI